MATDCSWTALLDQILSHFRTDILYMMKLRPGTEMKALAEGTPSDPRLPKRQKISMRPR
jgi:hypothetical protein